MQRLAGVLGHRDRHEPLRAYVTGLCLPGDRKSIESMVARVDPRHVRSRHQAMHHVIADAPCDERAVLCGEKGKPQKLLGSPRHAIDPGRACSPQFPATMEGMALPNPFATSSDAAILKRVEHIVRRALSPHRANVYHFGFWARGLQRPASDIDVVIEGRFPCRSPSAT